MDEGKVTQAGIYARVSTIPQNIESQLMPIREYCARNNFKVFKEYLDQGVSGVKGSRPQLDLMMTDVREGKLSTIIVYKLDRLGRSLKNLLDLLSEFRNKKIRVISVADGIDTAQEGPMARMFVHLLGVFGEFERELIRERVLAGLQRAKHEGRQLGRPKGRKDKVKRSKAGYLLRYVNKSKEARKLGPRKPKTSNEPSVM